MTDLSELIQFITRHYPLTDVQVTARLATKGLREALRVETRQGNFVVKITEPGRAEAVVQSDSGVLLFLEGQDFPAPRLFPGRQGDAYLPYRDSFMYLYGYLEGKHPMPSPAFLHQAGQILGRLHNLPFEGFGRVSGYHPAEILAEVSGYLERALDTDQHDLALELLERVRTFPDLECLPRGIIHTDPYLVNWIEDPSGKLFLIDWDDAGIGIPLLDAGYCSVHLSTYPRHEAARWGVPVTGTITWRQDWTRAFVDGYQQVRPLSALERELFPAAVELSVLAYVWDWETDRLIPENIERMNLMRDFRIG